MLQVIKQGNYMIRFAFRKNFRSIEEDGDLKLIRKLVIQVRSSDGLN